MFDSYKDRTVFVAAAGNDGSQRCNYPCAYDGVYCVVASNQSDNKASFSTYGAHTDISAPGKDILSTAPG